MARHRRLINYTLWEFFFLLGLVSYVKSFFEYESSISVCVRRITIFHAASLLNLLCSVLRLGYLISTPSTPCSDPMLSILGAKFSFALIFIEIPILKLSREPPSNVTPARRFPIFEKYPTTYSLKKNRTQIDDSNKETKTPIYFN